MEPPLNADFEGEYKAVANGLNRKGVFVASADGWESPTGAIEVKKDQDNQGQAASGESFVELNTDSAGITQMRRPSARQLKQPRVRVTRLPNTPAGLALMRM